MIDPELRPLLTGHRREAFRWDVLDAVTEAFLFHLDGVDPMRGEFEFSIFNTIKGGGSFTYVGKEKIDWDHVLIQPWYSLEGPLGSTSWPLGVFIPSTPGVAYSGTGTEVNVELYDQLLTLSEDKINGTYSIPAGAIVTDVIQGLITVSAQTTNVLVEPSADTLRNPMVWTADTTTLQVVNDLLDTINYFSLYCDGQGTFRGEPYVKPADRPVEWEFADDEFSIYEPEFSVNYDAFAVPNEYILVSMGSDEVEGLTSRATDTDPDSKFSYQARNNRWISRTEEGIEVSDQAILDDMAERKLKSAQQASTTVDFTHAPLNLGMNEAVTFRRDLEGIDLRAVVQRYTVSTELGVGMKTTILEVSP